MRSELLKLKWPQGVFHTVCEYAQVHQICTFRSQAMVFVHGVEEIKRAWTVYGVFLDPLTLITCT